MNSINAYYIGGPKHGDVDIVDSAARDIRVAVTDEVRRSARIDMGHYSYDSMMSPPYGEGIYQRQHELYGVPGMNQSRRHFVFLWAGVS